MFTGLGSGAVSVGSEVRRWVNELDARYVQAPADAQRPQLVDGFGGRPVVEFTPANSDGFDLSANYSDLTSASKAFTMFLVVQLAALPTAEGYELMIHPSGLFDWRIAQNGNMTAFVYDGSPKTSGAKAVTAATPHVLSMRCSGDGGTVKVGVDGVEGTASPAIGSMWWDTSTPAPIMRSNYAKFNGQMAALAVYNVALNDTDFAATVAALTEDYVTPAITIPDVASTFRVAKQVYALSSVSGLRKWVDYIPVAVPEGEVAASDVGSYNDSGCLHTTGLSSVSGLRAWVDYTPVYVVTATAGKQWRTDDDGWIPVSDV
jgi:hypothetical protein